MAITDKDITKLKTVFATKEELAGAVNGLRGEITSLRVEIMGGLDKIMGELDKAREDRVFAQGKDREQDKRLDSLEEKVGKVEAKVV